MIHYIHKYLLCFFFRKNLRSKRRTIFMTSILSYLNSREKKKIAFKTCTDILYCTICSFKIVTFMACVGRSSSTFADDIYRDIKGDQLITNLSTGSSLSKAKI